MTTTGTTAAGKPRKDGRSRMTGKERREQLLDIGRSLFAQKGFDATSVEEIAAKAGVSKPVVYEHFGGKEGLYAVVVDREMRSLLDAITGALTSSGHPRELLEQARQRSQPAGPDDLRWQVEQAQADLNLAERLDAARIKAASLLEVNSGVAAVESLYVEAFAEAGLGRERDDINAVAAHVRDAALSAELNVTSRCSPRRSRLSWRIYRV